MKKLILTYGLVSGAIIIGSMLIGINMASESEGVQFQEWMGYLFMIVALSLVFIGIKRYRDQDLGGVITFKTAFLLGLGITAVASVIYVGVWEINLAATDYAFIGEYAQAEVEAKNAAGVTGPELESFVAEMDRLVEQYASPLFRIPMTFLEIFPVGLLITLIAAALLKNSSFMVARPSGG